MKRIGTTIALALAAWLAPIAHADTVTSTETSVDLLSSTGAQIGLSSENKFPVTAMGPDGLPMDVAVGSSPYFGPVVFDDAGQITNWTLLLYQDGSIHVVPRGENGASIMLAMDFTQDNPDRPSSPGEVPIPEEYEYDPFALHPGLHDYCTASPNYYVTPELNADFRGACAGHDLCMERSQWFDYGYGWCNTALLLDLRAVCHSVYTGELEKHQQGCLDTADLYFAAVTLRHIKRI